MNEQKVWNVKNGFQLLVSSSKKNNKKQNWCTRALKIDTELLFSKQCFGIVGFGLIVGF